MGVSLAAAAQLVAEAAKGDCDALAGGDSASPDIKGIKVGSLATRGVAFGAATTMGTAAALDAATALDAAAAFDTPTALDTAVAFGACRPIGTALADAVTLAAALAFALALGAISLLQGREGD